MLTSPTVDTTRRHQPRVVVSVHDVSPATADETHQWCTDADNLGIPVSLLVIPGPWRGMRLDDAPDYAQVLQRRAAQGDDLVLHGWTHTAGPEGTRLRRTFGRLVARGAAEFAALDAATAAQRLAAGQQVMTRHGLATEGFTPPGWLASPGTHQALRETGFRYVTTHIGVHDLSTARLHRAFALSHRPGGGRSAERLAAAALGAWARHGARRGALVRIALHPDDLHRPGLRDHTLRAIEAILAAGGRALTYAALVAS